MNSHFMRKELVLVTIMMIMTMMMTLMMIMQAVNLNNNAETMFIIKKTSKIKVLIRQIPLQLTQNNIMNKV
jgi:hypothetical protein